MSLEQLENMASPSRPEDLIVDVAPKLHIGSEDPEATATALSADLRDDPDDAEAYLEAFPDTDADEDATWEISQSQLVADAAAQRSIDPIALYLREIGKVPLLSAVEEVELAQDIEAGLYADYKLQLAASEGIDVPASTRRDLQDMVRRGKTAKHHLIVANLRLVVSNAKRSNRRELPLLDAIQEGNLGLIRAVEKFDYTKGIKFSTYATWWLRQAIGRGAKEQLRIIRAPIAEVEVMERAARVANELSQKLGRHPESDELASELNMPIGKLEALRARMLPTVSLDAPLSNMDDTTWGDRVAELLAEERDDILTRKIGNGTLQAAVQGLDDHEQQAFAIWLGKDTLTLSEIGRHISLSKAATDILLRRCFAKLSHPATGLIGEAEDNPWQLSGVCRQIGVNMFFPKKGAYDRKVNQVCDTCPVQTECLEFAVSNGIKPGIWGGMSISRRNKWARQARQSAVPPNK